MQKSAAFPLSRSLVAVAALLSLSVADKAHAFAPPPNGYSNGNPFSNGTFFVTDGTYQGTIRGKNVSGVAVFSTGSADAHSTNGYFSLTFKGYTYLGNVTAAVDPSSGQIAATLEASEDRSGTGQLITILQRDSSTLTSTGTTVTVVTNGTTVTTATSATSSQSVTNTDYTATTNYNDVLYVSGSFLADLINSYPNQLFQGKGSATFRELDLTFSPTNSSALAVPQIISTTVKIKVDGVRTANTTATYNPFTIDVPYALTTYQIVETTRNSP